MNNVCIECGEKASMMCPFCGCDYCIDCAEKYDYRCDCMQPSIIKYSEYRKILKEKGELKK